MKNYSTTTPLFCLTTTLFSQSDYPKAHKVVNDGLEKLGIMEKGARHSLSADAPCKADEIEKLIKQKSLLNNFKLSKLD